jgi:[histone H3]-lysine4 N-trimethyltransferase ASH1L
MWGEGIEVMKTDDRGHGVRSMRAFEPGQVIVEYTGEIITPDEGDRRMNEDYKGKTVSGVALSWCFLTLIGLLLDDIS